MDGVDWDVGGCGSESGLLDEGIILVDINVFLKAAQNASLALQFERTVVNVLP